MKTLSVATRAENEFVDITREVRELVEASGVASGLCVVFVPHTTAGITVNEAADPDVKRDMLMELGKIVPLADGYRHAEGNSAAHLKAALTGPSVSIPISGSTLALGTWQGIFFCEFDGPRSRKVHVQILKA